ncbi:MAG: hypothetical protein JNL50_07010 [Phycisphaerae bacterium]|nr:hypothetical protein [Phycisphaerae bacterium]
MLTKRGERWALATALALWATVLGALLLLPGCSGGPELRTPQTNVAPYNASRGEVLFAVVPLRNESGATVLDRFAISDKVVAATEEVRGVRCLPLNRTIEAMRALKLSEIRTPHDARTLAGELGVEGLLIGSITAFDPYTPTIGLNLALYAKPGTLGNNGVKPLDVRVLSSSAIEHATPSDNADRPLALVSENLDGKNHQVQMDVRSYAEGRTEALSALGWRRYLASMDLFSEFAASYVVGRLIQSEWIRLAGHEARGEEARD